VLIPIGLDNARLSRWPWVSLSIAGICVLAWLLAAFSGNGWEIMAAHGEAVGYLRRHPYLQAPPPLARLQETADGARRVPAPPPGLTAADLAREQRELDALAEHFTALREGDPEYRFSLVPSRGLLQPGWLTHLFMHAGLGHLLGNLFFFLLLVGPFLEDAWGAPFFGAFYLVGGLVAAAVEVPMIDPDIALLGASGAISACMGAFALRFAHRRVRMFYWFWIVVRGQFFVPAWAYALLAFGGDLVGLWFSGRGGGVAYGAHVGGFLFGLGVAAAVRATGLEERFAPEGAVRWQRGMQLNRAAEAAAGGDLMGARAELQETLRRRPGDLDAALELARLEARGYDALATTDALEPVLARRAGAGDAQAVRALLEEFGTHLRAHRLKPATAYRVAELAGDGDPLLVQALYEAAGAAGGGLGAKAYTKLARRLASSDPARARELAERAAQLAPDPALAAQAREVAAELPGPAAPAQRAVELEPAAALAGEPVRVIWCKVAALQQGALDLTTAEGRTARLAPARVELVAAAQLEVLAHGGAERRNGVVLDLALRSRPGEPRVVLRLAGHEMNLAALRPGVPPGQAYADLIGWLLTEGGGQALPDAARAQGRPFARLQDLEAFERACYGRRLAEG
jgi:membrane associated rhomboid family serine protease